MYHWILLATALLQLLLLALSFPATEILSNKPLLTIDNAMHWYRLHTATALAREFNLIGYDPMMGAGVPAGITVNPAAKFPALLAILLSGFFSSAKAWKIYVFSSAWLAPLCIPVAARLLRFENAVIAVASFLGLLLWWASMFRWFHTAGLVSYVFMSYLSVLYFALLYTFLVRENRLATPVALLSVLGALLFFLHPLFFIPAALSAVVLLIVLRDHVTPTKLMYLLCVIPVIAITPNLIWIYPLYFDRIYADFSTVSHQAIADIMLMVKEALGIWDGWARGARIYPFLIIAALSGLFFSRTSEKGRPVAALAAVAAILILYAALGAHIEKAAGMTQPNRFAVMGYLFLSMVSAFGAVSLLQHWKQRSPGMARAAIAGLVAVLTFGGSFAANEVRREVTAGNHGRYGVAPPEVRGLGEYANFLLEQIPKSGTSNDRILFETANGRFHDNSHLAGFLSISTAREFIGGPYPHTHFAGYWDGFLFGRPIDDIPYKEMMSYLDLYNVGVVVAYSEASRQYWNGAPGVRPKAQYKGVAVYDVSNNESSFFYAGTGVRVNSTTNLVEFSEVSGDEVILKYHFLKGLRAAPEVDMEPVYLKDDPNPFIKINSPPASFKLFL